MRRRDFLIGAGATAGLGALASARGRLSLRQESAPPRLVWLDLDGGNDGLNTVVPFADDAYHRARPELRLPASEVLRLDDRIGVHPVLERLHARALDGGLGIVHGVGYPRPNLSHFKSSDIWQAGDLTGRSAGSGWIGRLTAQRHPTDLSPDRLVHIGNALPYALYSPDHPAVAFAAAYDYRFAKGERELGRVNAGAGGGSDRLDFLRGVAEDARQSSAAVRAAIEDHEPTVEYPNGKLARSLSMAAALIASPVECEAVSLEHGSFDTHVDQATRHRTLLSLLDGALGPFLDELDSMPQAGRTLVVVSSEFGRRVAENGSGGTDHGTAGPVLICGPAARGGEFGKLPDLERLDERENLRFTTDFRRVLATVIGGHFGAEVESVLGERFAPLPFLAS